MPPCLFHKRCSGVDYFWTFRGCSSAGKLYDLELVLGARCAQERSAAPPTAAIWEKWLCLVDTEPNRGEVDTVGLLPLFEFVPPVLRHMRADMAAQACPSAHCAE